MKNAARLVVRAVLLGLALPAVLGGAACRMPDGPRLPPDLAAAADAAEPPRDAAAPDLLPRDLRAPADLATCPAAMPPPTMCNQRSAGRTAIQLLVRIDEYRGLITGANGVHEIAFGTVVCTPWVYDRSLVDTGNVQLAMNVSSPGNPEGLPMEVPLRPGQLVEALGEYIPAGSTTVSNMNGKAAVVHYTHSPCGWVRIGGTLYTITADSSRAQ